VTLYEPLVFRWCRRWGLRADDARNVVQEVFAAVAKGLAGFEHAGGSFRRWLCTVARHECVDYVRKSSSAVTGVGGSDALRKMLQVPAPESASVDEATLADERGLLYRRALEIIRGSFSESDWRAFSGVVCDERTPADLAKELGVTVNKVYLAKSRILRKLRAEFRELLDAYD
jgi:RNA polymerase sigma-70 factor, ECF subfamily